MHTNNRRIIIFERTKAFNFSERRDVVDAVIAVLRKHFGGTTEEWRLHVVPAGPSHDLELVVNVSPLPLWFKKETAQQVSDELHLILKNWLPEGASFSADVLIGNLGHAEYNPIPKDLQS